MNRAIMPKKNSLEPPSVTGTTYFIFIILGVCFLLGTVFLGLALGLFLESALEYHFFIDMILIRSKITTPIPNAEIWKIANIYGFFCLFLSLVLFLNCKISRMVLVRNHYIMEIQEKKQ